MHKALSLVLFINVWLTGCSAKDAAMPADSRDSPNQSKKDRDVIRDEAISGKLGADADPKDKRPDPDVDSDFKFDPVKDTLVATDADWVVWGEGTLIPETKNNVAVGLDWKYFVEHLGGERRAFAAYQNRGGSRPDDATVLADGTMLLNRFPNVVWAAPGQVARVEESSEVLVLAVYPDGVIARLGEGPQPPLETIWWVPILDRKFNLAGKIQLEDGVGASSRLALVRHRDKIAWVDDTRDASLLNENLRRPPILFVFGLPQHEVRTVSLRRSSVGRLKGFDGRHAIDDSNVINVVTGEDITIPDIQTIGIVDGSVYSVRETNDAYVLMAIPFDHPDAKMVYRLEKRKLSRIPKDQRDGIDWNGLFFVRDDTVGAWDGTSWAALSIVR